MARMRRFPLLLLIAFTLAGCQGGPTDPTTDIGPRGRLAGVVTIGPFCPGPTTTAPCPTPPSAYLERKVLVYDETGARLIFTVDIDTQGAYLISLEPGRYLVDVKKVGLDHTADVPKVVTIEKNLTTALNISIDTGIR
jgi:hypothetical protein